MAVAAELRVGTVSALRSTRCMYSTGIMGLIMKSSQGYATTIAAVFFWHVLEYSWRIAWLCPRRLVRRKEKQFLACRNVLEKEKWRLWIAFSFIWTHYWCIDLLSGQGGLKTDSRQFIHSGESEMSLARPCWPNREMTGNTVLFWLVRVNSWHCDILTHYMI